MLVGRLITMMMMIMRGCCDVVLHVMRDGEKEALADLWGEAWR